MRLRNVRVNTPPIQVRVGGVFGQLINISATGALVKVPQALWPDREVPVFIDLPAERLQLRGRVSRYDPFSSSALRPAWLGSEYVLGITFTDLPPKAQEALKALCGDVFFKQE